MKKHFKFLSIFFVFVLSLIIITSCSTDNVNDNNLTENHNIYFSGYYTINEQSKLLKTKQFIKKQTDEENIKSCFWKLQDNELIKMDVETLQQPPDDPIWIYVKNGTVYYPVTKEDNDNLYAYYYTIDPSGVITSHKISENPAEANYIMVDDNNKIYVAGTYQNDPSKDYNACFFEINGNNTIPHVLTGGSDAIHLNIKNDKVYIVGRATTEETQFAYYWVYDEENSTQNGYNINPDNATWSTCIGSFLKDDKLYISGSYVINEDNNSTRKACYWRVNINNQNYNVVDLPDNDQGEDPFAFNIFVDNNDVVYIAGNSSDGHPCYWIDNGEQIEQHILDSDIDGYATAIWKINNKIYISGQYTVINEQYSEDDPNYEVAYGCYWIVENGEIEETNTLSEKNSYISSIFVE